MPSGPIRRIAEGEFGCCLSCGKRIAPKRQELDPTTAACIDGAAPSGGWRRFGAQRAATTSLDCRKITPLSFMLRMAAASEPSRSMARQASSMTKVSNPSLRASTAE